MSRIICPHSAASGSVVRDAGSSVSTKLSAASQLGTDDDDASTLCVYICVCVCVCSWRGCCVHTRRGRRSTGSSGRDVAVFMTLGRPFNCVCAPLQAGVLYVCTQQPRKWTLADVGSPLISLYGTSKASSINPLLVYRAHTVSNKKDV